MFATKEMHVHSKTPLICLMYVMLRLFNITLNYNLQLKSCKISVLPIVHFDLATTIFIPLEDILVTHKSVSQAYTLTLFYGCSSWDTES